MYVIESTIMPKHYLTTRMVWSKKKKKLIAFDTGKKAWNYIENEEVSNAKVSFLNDYRP
jgi:hypothetical protein